jgi:hypothetical protein
VQLKARGVEIIRVKIECPYYETYRDASLYLEAHWPTEDTAAFPVSRSRHKKNLVATDRTYVHQDYDAFRARHQGHEVELCLYDSYCDEDQDWLGQWEAFRDPPGSYHTLYKLVLRDNPAAALALTRAESQGLSEQDRLKSVIAALWRDHQRLIGDVAYQKMRKDFG